MSMPRSLVLITVDCMRADHAGFLGYQRGTTPFLDSLAGSSMVFSDAIVAGAPTYYSFPAIMASRHPLALGRDVIGVAPGEATIASALRESGYATGAFLAGNPYLSPHFGYDAGFDTFRDFLDSEVSGTESSSTKTGHTEVNGPENNSAEVNSVPGSPAISTKLSLRKRLNEYLANACYKHGPAGSIYDELYFRYCQRVADRSISSFDSLRRFPAAEVIVDEANAWLDSVSGSPFFLWLHFMDPHSPYYPRQEALQWLGDSTSPAQARYLNSYWNRSDIGASRLERRRKDVIALYDAGIRWMDAQTRRLVDELRRRELWQNCVFAVTADHGEEFLEHGGRHHSPSKLTEELIHVPLLLHGSRSDATGPEFRRGPFSLIHLAPTLFGAIGIPAPASFQGRSFWKQSQVIKDVDETAIVESIGTCTNPFEPAQRRGSRVLAVREIDYKLVIDFATGQENLFNLRNDPGELRPLSPEDEKPVRRRLLERAREHIARSASSRDAGQRLDAQLRDLRLEWRTSAGNIST